MSEKEVEDTMVVPLLQRLGWDLVRTVRRQHEMEIKIGAGRPQPVRADFVGYRDALGSDSLLVIETKRKIRSDTELRVAVEQCESYAGKLRCSRFAIAAPEGFWVYHLKFPGQSTMLANVQLSRDIAPTAIEKLRPFIGYEALRAQPPA